MGGVLNANKAATTKVQICGKNKSCTNKYVTFQIFSLLPCWKVWSAYILCEANSGLLRWNIPPLHIFFWIAKVLVPTFPIASLGILDWIKFLSGPTSQLTHLSRMRLKRSVAIWNRQKYNKDNNGPATSQSVGQPVRVCCDCGRDIRGIFPFRLFCPLPYQRHLPRVRETFVLDYSTQKTCGNDGKNNNFF